MFLKRLRQWFHPVYVVRRVSTGESIGERNDHDDAVALAMYAVADGGSAVRIETARGDVLATVANSASR